MIFSFSTHDTIYNFPDVAPELRANAFCHLNFEQFLTKPALHILHLQGLIIN